MRPPFRLLTAVGLLAFLAVAAWLLARGTGDAGGFRSAPVPTIAQTETPEEPSGPAPSEPPTPTAVDVAAPATGTPDEPRLSLQGCVVDDDTGRGVAGAHVVAVADWKTLEGTLTAADGSFLLSELTADPTDLFAWHVDYGPALVKEVMVERPVQIRLPRGWCFEGRVLDEAGKPVAGATVRFQLTAGDLFGPDEARTVLWWRKASDLRTDGSGTFRTRCMPPALHGVRLGALADGYAGRWTDPLDLDGREPPAAILLEVARTCAVSGRVRGETPPGTGDAKVLVGLEWDSSERLELDWLFERVEEQSPSVGGTWRLEGLPPAELELYADWSDPFLEGVAREVKGLRSGEEREGVDLELPARAVLRVRLRDAVGRPLPGEQIFVRQPADADPEEDFVPSQTTDGRGRIELAAYAGVEVEVVHLRPDGAKRTLRRLTPHGLEEVEVVSEPSPRTELEVHVVDADGDPVPRFASSVCSVVRESRYRLRRGPSSDRFGREGVAWHLVVGTAPLEVAISGAKDEQGGRMPLTDRTLTIESVPSDGVVTVTLYRSDELRGRVVDVAGSPVPGTRVFLVIPGDFLEPPSERRELPVDAFGRFVLPLDADLRRALAHLEVEAPVGYVPVPSIRLDPREGERVVVLRRGGEIAGRVLPPEALGRFAEGEPLTVHVWWQDDETGHILRCYVPVEGDGAWRVLGVPRNVVLQVALRDDRACAGRASCRRPLSRESARAHRTWCCGSCTA